MQGDEGEELGVKPMNCPGHCVLFANRKRSYRELPLRFAEFSRLHRNERSGTLTGLSRVRSMAQDDAHIYCEPEQMEGELASFFEMTEEIYGALGISGVEVGVSTRPEGGLRGRSGGLGRRRGDADRGRQGSGLRLPDQARRRRLLRPEGRVRLPGRPRAALDALDPPDRRVDARALRPASTWGATVRCIGPPCSTGPSWDPWRRFIALYIEMTRGDFPFWLAPVQVVVLPISDRHLAYARQVEAKLSDAGIRVEVDDRSEKLGFKIREAEVQKIPVMLVVGDKEVESGTVTPRWRHGSQNVEGCRRGRHPGGGALHRKRTTAGRARVVGGNRSGGSKKGRQGGRAPDQREDPGAGGSRHQRGWRAARAHDPRGCHRSRRGGGARRRRGGSRTRSPPSVGSWTTGSTSTSRRRRRARARATRPRSRR